MAHKINDSKRRRIYLLLSTMQYLHGFQNWHLRTPEQQGSATAGKRHIKKMKLPFHKESVSIPMQISMFKKYGIDTSERPAVKIKT